MSWSIYAIFLTTAVGVTGSTSVSVSRQVQLGPGHFFVPPIPVAAFESWRSDLSPGHDDLIPLTVVHLNDTPSASAIETVLSNFEANDDVWQKQFAQVLFAFRGGHETEVLETDWVKDLSLEYPITTALSSSSDTQPNARLPSGPYFVHRYTGLVYQAYKLYVDSSQTFVQSSYQDAHGVHHTLPAAITADAALTIAVPSRLYFTVSDSQPLAGLRIGVKDLFDLRGLKTGGGSRALHAMSDVQTSTATAVQVLIDAGAVVVGKNKLAEFAFASHFVTENVDYLLPFNPRGDGYNAPGASSGGSAAAVESYDWLDVTLGSDTGGSIRAPAFYNGVHGNRPTLGAVGMEGALPLSSTLDTAGTLARDPEIWSRVNRVLYGNLTDNFTSYPKTIIIDGGNTAPLLKELETTYPEVHAAAQGFIDALADHLGPEVSVVNLDDRWADTAPSELLDAEPRLDMSMQSIYLNCTFYEQWNEFGKGFVEQYIGQNEGRFPYMVYSTRRFWYYASQNLTEEMHDLSLDQRRQMEEWASKELVVPDDETCSKSIFLYFLPPWSSYLYKPDISNNVENPWIADLIAQAAKGGNGTSSNSRPIIQAMRLASLAGLPDYTVTLGSFDLGQRTHSNATMQTQALPFGVNIVAAKGCDYMILDLVQELHKKGVIKTARTGMLV